MHSTRLLSSQESFLCLIHSLHLFPETLGMTSQAASSYHFYHKTIFLFSYSFPFNLGEGGRVHCFFFKPRFYIKWWPYIVPKLFTTQQLFKNITKPLTSTKNNIWVTFYQLRNYRLNIVKIRTYLQRCIWPLWSLALPYSVSVMIMVTMASKLYISLKGLQHRSRGILSGIWCNEAGFWVLNCSLALTKSSTHSICMSMYVSVYVCETERERDI